MRQHISVAGCLILLLWPLQVHTKPRFGNCSFAKDTPFYRVCQGTVKEYMFYLYMDRRAPEDSRYVVWESKKSNDSNVTKVLVSFHENILTDYEIMKVNFEGSDKNSNVFLGGSVNSSNVDELSLTPSGIYCFTMNLRYPIELKYHCLGYDRGPDDEVANMTVLHYAIPEIQPKIASDASTCCPFGALLLVVSTMVVLVPS